MFQLFKKRNFNDLIGDTFIFFKLYGKHYFKNYLIINGGFLLVLLVLVFFVFKIFYEGLFSGLNSNMPENQFEAFIMDNLVLFLGSGVLSVLLLLIITMISYLYPVVYLDLLSKTKEFDTNDIIKRFKDKIGRVILFFILSLVIALPFLGLLFMLCFLLVFVLIGIPMLLIMIPAASAWLLLSFYHYIATDADYFTSLSKAMQMLRNKFWPIVGSTFIMYLIIQTIVGIISMIPYVIGIFSAFTSLQDPNTFDSQNAVSIMMISVMILFLLSVLLNFFMQNLLLVNNGVIYYSLREEAENNSPKNDIDLIGTQSE